MHIPFYKESMAGLGVKARRIVSRVQTSNSYKHEVQIKCHLNHTCFYFFKRLYLFIFRQKGKEGERGKETSMCGCLSHAPSWGSGPQPRHVP